MFLIKTTLKNTSMHLAKNGCMNRFSCSGLLNNSGFTEAIHSDVNKRFWSKKFRIPVENCDSPTEALKCIFHSIKANHMVLPKTEMGMLLVPKHKMIIPVYSGVIQTQHIIVEEGNASELDKDDINEKSEQTLALRFCGFHTRGSSTSVEQDIANSDRVIDNERKTALDDALVALTDVTGEELLSSPEYIGTSPSRMYKSFICPRTNGTYKIEPVQSAANRMAIQIELGLRQLRADLADYLRNTDKSVPMERLEPKELNPLILVLDNVRAANNVGSLFRTCETAGVQELITSGISPHPPHPKLRKTALGSDLYVPTRHVMDTLSTVLELKSQGYFIVAMETTTKSVCYTDVKYPKKTVVIVGNEVTGVDPRIMDIADVIAEIPMFGIKNSLNVAAATPIVLFEILRQWKV